MRRALAAARSDLELLADGGGFILSPGCALPYETPDENIRALVEIAKTEGWYASATSEAT